MNTVYERMTSTVFVQVWESRYNLIAVATNLLTGKRVERTVSGLTNVNEAIALAEALAETV